MSLPPQFLLFDMGNVVLHFDHRRAAAQMAEVAGLEVDVVWQLVFADGLNDALDAGTISDDEFFETFCRETATRPDRARLIHAASNIFSVNVPVAAMVGQLHRAGCRKGLLSNTCSFHWQFILDQHYGVLPAMFEFAVLSFQLQLTKPQPEIYHHAARRAGVPIERIFYVDDVQANVDGALAVGMDAVRFITARQLAEDLRARGVPFNF